MKTINVTFTDEEYAELKEKKDKEKIGWHDWIIKNSLNKEVTQ
jgi:hypothetical protein